MHVGQAEVAALVTVGQLGVVEAEQVEQGGVQVVDVNGVLGRVEPEFVRRQSGSFLSCDNGRNPGRRRRHLIQGVCFFSASSSYIIISIP